MPFFTMAQILPWSFSMVVQARAVKGSLAGPRSRSVSRHVTLYLLLLEVSGCRHPRDDIYTLAGFCRKQDAKRRNWFAAL